MHRFKLILLACALTTLVPACAAKQKTMPSADEYYQQAEFDFSKHEWDAAIENYQFVVDKYPFSPYAETAEMKIGLAYYRMNHYAEAIASLDDFQRMHPTSKSLPMVNYYIAMSYLNQIGREDQDQTKTEQALGRFETLEQRFPETEFSELAREKSEMCREELARHDKIVGDYYFKRANFAAAESRMAELMEKYPETPVAPDALWELGMALEKEGKKYSAAQAFAAEVRHFPDTPYTKRAEAELAKLKQPVDTEVDPLKLVLTENGFGTAGGDNDNQITVRQQGDSDASGNPAYGEDSLPVLDQPTGANASATNQGPQHGPTLKTVRLAAANPPLSVILDLSAPVKFEKHLDKGDGYSTVTLLLKGATPTPGMPPHLAFDRSIFKDCDISSDDSGTTVTINTVAVADFAVVPLDNPPRLLLTFTPENSAMGEGQNSAF